VHTRRYLYVEYLNGWRELYDLRTDPWELDNVAQSPRYAQIKASLHTELLALESSPGETS
jgi:N-acetylglucosamine-6-sulfatase